MTLLPSARSRSSPPIITEQPGTLTGNEEIFDPRENVKLPCVADADPPPVSIAIGMCEKCAYWRIGEEEG